MDKVRRLTSVFSIPSGTWEDVEQNLRTEFDDSLADKRYFEPVRESVKNIPSGSLSDSGLYDFPNGKDNGMQVPISRKKGVDIAEVSQSVRKDTEKVRSKIKEQQEINEVQKQIDDLKTNNKSSDN